MNPPDPRSLTQTIADANPGATPGTQPLPSANARPTLTRSGVAEEHASGAPRYHLGERRGSGATGSVYTAYDADLARMVAVKVLDQTRRSDRFTREARILAGLEHPHIAPLYDFDRTAEGKLCFTMRLVEGQSLGDAIAAVVVGQEPVVPITSVMERVVIIRKICDALLYAHHQGVLHQDIKPDNILLGKFGEVLLADWGAASAKDEVESDQDRKRLVGTPAYLAPEIARGETPTIASEIYALGSSLFQLLTWRFPLWDEDPERFWRRRRAGEIDPLTADERQTLPAPLIAIVLRSLAADPEQRYQDIQDFADDLDAFQAGLAVSAYTDPFFVRISRWHRQHARSLWASVAVASVVITTALILYGERLKRIATWGQPIYHDSFTHETLWNQYWKCTYGKFDIRDGRLVSTAAMGSDAYFKRRCEGDTAIEYTGMLLPGEAPCDVSALYAITDPFDRSKPIQRYMLQVGANDNSYAQILDTHGNRVAFSPLSLEIGRPYAIRMEIEGASIRIFVDGVAICEHRELFPIPSGWIGIYGWYPGKTFDNLNVYNKGMPQQVSVLAIGDQYCQDKEWDSAAKFYQRVATTYPNKSLGLEAVYRQGYAERQAGRENDAQTTWEALPEGRWKERARFHALEDRLALGDFTAVIAGIRKQYIHADADLRLLNESLWGEAVHRSLNSTTYDLPTVESLLQLQFELFPNRRRESVAEALISINRPQAVLDRFSDQGATACQALLCLGRNEEVLSTYPELRFQVGIALISMGRFTELADMDPPLPLLVHNSENYRTINLHSIDLANQHAKVDADIADVDTYLGAANLIDRADFAVERLLTRTDLHPRHSGAVVTTFFIANRSDELLRRYPHSTVIPTLLQYQSAISSFRKGGAVHAVETDPGNAWYAHNELWISQLLLKPMIAHLAGDGTAMSQAIADLSAHHRWHFMQQPWHAAEFLAGHIDAAGFLKQPCLANSEQLLDLCQGIRCELERNSAGALDAYRRFLARPSHERALIGWMRDPIAEDFIQWRAEALAGSQVP